MNRKTINRRRTIERNKKQTYDRFGSKCNRCGEIDLTKLEFHHIDPATKLYNIGSIWQWTTALLIELEKCELLCKSCHRGDAEHGTRSKYNSGCRCDLCTRANTDYEFERRTGRYRI